MLCKNWQRITANNFCILPVIGITGSNGKTIVKEWLNQLLEADFSIVRSPKSYNSQIGVPLSVLNINTANNLAIFEAGISQSGEMEKLEKIIQPSIGIFTNIGEAHAEGFENITQKINEKLKLFIHAKQLIFCADDKRIKNAILVFQKENKIPGLFSWGKDRSNKLQIFSINKKKTFTKIEAVYNVKKYYCFNSFYGRCIH